MIDATSEKNRPHFPDNRLLTRRQLLRGFAYAGATIGLATTYGVGRISSPLLEQYETWQAASQPVAAFLQSYEKQLARIHFGANLCPDYQLMAAEADPDRTVRLLKEYFGCTHVRLGMWWNTHVEHGLSAYNSWIEALLKYEIHTVISYGVKSPFPPETHFPPEIEQNLSALGVQRGDTIYANSPLGQMGLAYSDELLTYLDAAFGLESFYGFNPENEFDAHFGRHLLAIGEDLLHAQAERLYTPTQRRRLLLNTALISPPLRTASLTNVVNNALALRQAFPTLDPIVGADIYEETGSGRLGPNLYVDTFAGVRMRHGNSLMPDTKKTLAAAGIPLEVTEFQISDWITEAREYGPGSRIHTQYLLARITDHLLDEIPSPNQPPMIVRLWEMSKILVNMLQDEQYFYDNDAYALIQTINQRNAA